MGLAHFAAFLGLADSALPGFWLANQIARKYYIINSIDIIIIKRSNNNCKVSTACASVSGANTYVYTEAMAIAK